jgi:conjugal transfer pilus assembly protein TraD
LKHENLFRHTYEAYAAVGWTTAALFMLSIAMFTQLPSAAFWYMGLSSIGMASWRGYQTYSLWEFKINLVGKPFAFLKASMLMGLMKRAPGNLWLGYGFDWGPKHTQRVIEIRKRDAKTILPPQWFLKLSGIASNRPSKGAPWIHGIEPKEQNIYIPLQSLEGHSMVFGTTGAGKTRFLETAIAQAVRRGEVIIIIDPKGDKELREITKRACVENGRPNAFVEFHPAFPSRSARIDPLRNWNRSTELASRISALMPSNDSFADFAWRALNLVSDGLIYIEKAPNLLKLRRFIEGGPDALMEIVLTEFFNRKVPRWESLISPLVQKARDDKLKIKLSDSASPELKAYIHYYRHEVPESLHDQEVDGLLSMVEHSRDHLSKILASLVPLLVKLTAGELGKTLSPDADDINDTRPIFDTKKLVNGGHVLYLGTDSLSDATVGSAIGSIILSDLAAVAGDRYNYSNVDSMPKVQLFIDEAAEVTNTPLIQILNKGRGAGFVVTLFAQTMHDFTNRLGSETLTRQMLGNCNNLFALRTIDRSTQEYIVETFGQTMVTSITRSHGSGSRTEDHGIDFTGNTSESMSEKETEIFPPWLLGMLPDLHYIALVSGGRLIKGRLPKLTNG